MNQIIRHGKVVRSALGITVKDADAEDAAYVGLDAVAGVRVDGFGEDSPAKRAGLLPGDVIVAIDGQPMKYTAQLQQAIAFKDPGTTVAVAVARGTGRKEFTVRISAIPNDAEEVAAAPVEKKKP